MKKWMVIMICIGLFTNRQKIENYFYPPPDYAAMHQEDVVLYSTGWCGYCKQAKAIMEKNGTSYFEYDIEKSAEGLQQYKKLGGKGVPVIATPNGIIFGFDQAKISQL